MGFHMIVLRKSFYIRWSAERSPWVHEVNPDRDPSGRMRVPCSSRRYSLAILCFLSNCRF